MYSRNSPVEFFLIIPVKGSSFCDKASPEVWQSISKLPVLCLSEGCKWLDSLLTFRSSLGLVLASWVLLLGRQIVLLTLIELELANLPGSNNVPWTKLLDILYKNRCWIYNWPLNVVVPGLGFLIKSISSKGLHALVSTYLRRQFKKNNVAYEETRTTVRDKGKARAIVVADNDNNNSDNDDDNVDAEMGFEKWSAGKLSQLCNR